MSKILAHSPELRFSFKSLAFPYLKNLRGRFVFFLALSQQAHAANSLLPQMPMGAIGAPQSSSNQHSPTSNYNR